MKGIEHFREAEKYAEASVYRYQKWAAGGSNNEGGSYDDFTSATWQQRQAGIHAILAASVAVSNLVTVWGDIAGMMRADSEPADAPSQRAEPLVTCNAGPADDGPERCHLAIGHPGLHEHVYGSRAVHWSTADELRTITPEPPTTTEHWNAKLIREEAEAQRAKSIYQSTATDLHMEMP